VLAGNHAAKMILPIDNLVLKKDLVIGQHSTLQKDVLAQRTQMGRPKKVVPKHAGFVLKKRTTYLLWCKQDQYDWHDFWVMNHRPLL